jgi:3-hydroxyacyl-CoA dehydrogenase
LQALAVADYVVEAVPENEGLKTGIFRQLDALMPPHAVLASNTSSISITRLAAAMRRPDRVVGLHFMNPVRVYVCCLLRALCCELYATPILRSWGVSITRCQPVTWSRRGALACHLPSCLPSPFYPHSQVPLMALIELVRGLQTSDETFEATQRLAVHLGKTTCVSLDRPGFIVNRILVSL